MVPVTSYRGEAELPPVGEAVEEYDGVGDVLKDGAVVVEKERRVWRARRRDALVALLLLLLLLVVLARRFEHEQLLPVKRCVTPRTAAIPTRAVAIAIAVVVVACMVGCV